MTWFPTGAWWKVLSTDIQVEKPNNSTFTLPRAPTVAEKKAQYVPQKFNFAEIFYCPLFQGRVKRNVTYDNGTVKKNREESPLIEEVIRSKGCIEPSFFKKHGINYESHPSEFIEVFSSFEDHKYSKQKKEILFIKQLKKVSTTTQSFDFYT